MDYSGTRGYMNDSSYRSEPGTPLGLGADVRDVRDSCFLDTYEYPVSLRNDYFGSNEPYRHSYRGRSPNERGFHAYGTSSGSHGVDEAVRRTNLQVSLANGALTPRSTFAQVHPMMTQDGRFPREFSTPLSLQEFACIDRGTLDRILRAYRLPTNGLGSSLGDEYDSDAFSGYESMKVSGRLKLAILFDFLGAHSLADRARRQRTVDMGMGMNMRNPDLRRIGWRQ